MSSADHDRFEHVTRTLGPRVLGYLARRTAQPADAADLLAEVLLVAWRRIDDLPAEEEQAFAWLLGIARRVAGNHRRGKRRRNALADRLRTALQQHTTSATDTAEARLVADALAHLKAGDRELIMLIAWEGLSPSEAAQALGISPVAARKRLQRARERLRPMLDDAPPAPPPRAPRPIPETVTKP